MKINLFLVSFYLCFMDVQVSDNIRFSATGIM